MPDELLDATYIWTYSDAVEITTFCRITPDTEALGRWIVLDRADIGVHGLGDALTESVYLDDGRQIPRYDDYGRENYRVALCT